MKKRAQWRSKIGFIWAAVGSAVGLGSIWRFPYVVGNNGGATFIFLYLICLLIVGFPVLISEISLGRATQLSPGGAYRKIGGKKRWGVLGKMTILTGFLVSTFYSVIVGWTLGYLIYALKGDLLTLDTAAKANALFTASSTNVLFSVGFQMLFMFICFLILVFGVQKGIENSNKILMPLLLVVLAALAIKGLTLPGSEKGINFLFNPDWNAVTPQAIMLALGQAFFSLSLGQGTMITYGSYVQKKENLPTTALPITLFGVFVAILSGIAIFTIVFAAGMKPTAGPSLMFQTLPLIFHAMPGGYILCLAFFTLIFLAGLTSQISALEPAIAFLGDQFHLKRNVATAFVCILSMLVGIPSALSVGVLSGVHLFDLNIFDAIEGLCVNVLVPLGGLASVILVGWKWGRKAFLGNLHEGAEPFFNRYPFLNGYFSLSVRYIAPAIIIVIFLDAVGFFKIFT